MPFEQAYYTSSSSGLRGTHGFQINAASAGIPAPVLERIERVGAYSPPASSPPRPSDDEVQRFPVALFFHRIDEHGALIGQSKYIGRDYSGRFGNYFAHHLYAADVQAAFRELPPIVLWRSPIWATTESSSGTLDRLEGIVPGELIASRVDDMFHSAERRKRALPFLAAVQNALATRRRIIIVADAAEAAAWIAFASYALPRSLVLQLTFTTYTRNPYDTDALITGTTADTDFGFANYEVERQFTVIDLEGTRSTAASSTAFARAAAEVFERSGLMRLRETARFIDSVDPDLEISALEWAFVTASLAGAAVPELIPYGESLRWTSATLARWPVEALREVLRKVLSRYALADRDAAPLVQLLSACARDSLPAGIRTAAERAVLDWAFQTVAALPAELLRALATHSFAAESQEVAGSNADRWLEATLKIASEERLLANCEFAKDLILGKRPDIVERIAFEQFAPRLQDERILSWIAGCADDALFGPLMRGIARHVIAEAGRSDLLNGIANLLQIRGARIRLFRACFKLIRSGEDQSETHLRAAWETCMSRPEPTSAELKEAVRTMTGEELVGAHIAARIADAARRQGSMRMFNQDWLDVSEVLRKEDERAYENARPTYAAIESAVALMNSESHEAMLAFTSHLNQLSGMWITQLIELALEQIFDSRVRNDKEWVSAFHYTLLQRGCSSRPSAFFDFYMDAVISYLKPRSQKDRRRAAEALLADWVEAEPELSRTGCGEYPGHSDCRSYAEEFFSEKLFPTVYAFLKGEQKKAFGRSLGCQSPPGVWYRRWRSVQIKRQAKHLALISAYTLLATGLVTVGLWYAIPAYIESQIVKPVKRPVKSRSEVQPQQQRPRARPER